MRGVSERRTTQSVQGTVGAGALFGHEREDTPLYSESLSSTPPSGS